MTGSPLPLAIWSYRALGAGLAMYAMHRLADFSAEPVTTVPFVTSIVLTFAVPDQPAAKPTSIIAGHVISALAGLACHDLIGTGAVSASVAVGISLFAMLAGRCLHPPAGINAFLFPTLGLAPTWIWQPVLAGAVLLALASFTWRELGRWIFRE